MDVIVAFDLMERKLIEMPLPNVCRYWENFSICGLWIMVIIELK
jgi:hypothetical protein